MVASAQRRTTPTQTPLVHDNIVRARRSLRAHSVHLASYSANLASHSVSLASHSVSLALTNGWYLTSPMHRTEIVLFSAWHLLASTRNMLLCPRTMQCQCWNRVQMVNYWVPAIIWQWQNEVRFNLSNLPGSNAPLHYREIPSTQQECPNVKWKARTA